MHKFCYQNLKLELHSAFRHSELVREKSNHGAAAADDGRRSASDGDADCAGRAAGAGAAGWPGPGAAGQQRSADHAADSAAGHADHSDGAEQQHPGAAHVGAAGLRGRAAARAAAAAAPHPDLGRTDLHLPAHAGGEPGGSRPATAANG